MSAKFESLWNEYFAERCATIHTDEEKTLIRRAAEMHDEINRLLTKEQIEETQKYIELLYEIQSVFVKKAFFTGCGFATSFLFEALG